MPNTRYYIVNGITLYRLAAAPVLIVLVAIDRLDLFRWLLAVSFFTDSVDGYLSRKFKVNTVSGSKLDSIADDLTIMAAFAGIIAFRFEFLKQQIIPLSILFILYIVQVLCAFIRYGKMTSFHTWAAKVAAVLQGIFLILLFFLPKPVYLIYYVTLCVSAIDLLEEIMLVFLLREWQANVKGLFWKQGKKHAG